MSKLLILAILLISCSTKKPSKLHVEKIGLSKDTIEAGKAKKINYILYNEGKHKVRIKNYTLSCECTTSDIIKGSIINSKDSIAVSFVVKTHTTEKGENKLLLCSLLCDTEPKITPIEIPIYIK